MTDKILNNKLFFGKKTSLYLEEISEQEIIILLSNLKNNRSQDQTRSHLKNMCFTQGQASGSKLWYSQYLTLGILEYYITIDQCPW